MEKVLAFLKECGAYFYATTDGSAPRIRPFGSCMEYEGRIYIGMGKHKACFRQTVANPQFCICALKPNREWIRISGTAVLDDRPEVMEKVFERSPNLRRMYNEETGNVLGNFYIKNGRAEIYGASGEAEIIEF